MLSSNRDIDPPIVTDIPNKWPRLDPAGCLSGGEAALAHATGEKQYRFEKLCRHGRMAFNQNDLYVGISLLVYGEWAEFEMRLLGPLLRPGDVVIDAGANIGTHTVCFANAVGPTGRVYAFEPQRHVHDLLWNNVAVNGLLNQTICTRAAVGSVAGTLFVPDLPPHLILNFGALSLGDYDEGDTVPVVAIDDLDLHHCRLIKIDVEGMESEVLRGAEQTIRWKRPFLFVENDRAEHSAGLIAQIQALNYRILVHMAPCFNPDNYAGFARNMFPHSAGVNLLCVPVEAAFDETRYPGWDAGPVDMVQLLDHAGLIRDLLPSLHGTDSLRPILS
jgi:FkbM family methyltransferase